ncbi:MAG: UvrD-helicase domain-containing protein [Fusobacteria bacterium]|nr:UvrD-helicase domain-containing protein [Fusobacteriota bacterium]
MLEELNPEQREAARTLNGPLLILAGAGTGKTKTITFRMAYMLNHGILPHEILAVTFTNKAAREMKERVYKLVGRVAENMQISTFHAFGVQLLRTYGELIDVNRNFTIYDTDDQKKVVNKVQKEKNITLNDLTLSQIAGKISKLKESGTTPIEYEKIVRYPVEKAMAQIYMEYNKILRASNSVDFSDILLLSRDLLEIPQVLEKVQKRYTYIMVDEYQDTNKIQYDIVNYIAKRHKNLCVVGDEDQSIYGFRGADISNILNFEKDYKSAKVVKLEQNYRSTETILGAANEVIKNNTSSKGKKLWTSIKGSELIELLASDGDREEAYFVAHKLKKIGDFKNSAILYRNNFQSRQMEDELRRQNIPYKIYGGIQFYQRQEIKDILGYLRVLINPSDELNVIRIINTPARGIGQASLDKILLLARERGITLYDSLAFSLDCGIRGGAAKKAYDFYILMEEFKKIIHESGVSWLVRQVFERSGYKASLKEAVEDDRILNVEELINSAMDFEREEENLNLSTYLEYVSLAMASDDIEESESCVKLMTIHASKGLEFDNVFIIGFEDEIFPGSQKFSEEDVEEERRLCYVAITRAKQRLILSYARSRRIHGVMSFQREKSRFLSEIPKKFFLFEERQATGFAPKSNLQSYSNGGFSKNSSSGTLKNDIMRYSENTHVSDSSLSFKYKTGDFIKHKSFGEGKITSVDAEKVQIYFPGMGEKKFLTKIIDKFIEKIKTRSER